MRNSDFYFRYLYKKNEIKARIVAGLLWNGVKQTDSAVCQLEIISLLK